MALFVVQYQTHHQRDNRVAALDCKVLVLIERVGLQGDVSLDCLEESLYGHAGRVMLADDVSSQTNQVVVERDNARDRSFHGMHLAHCSCDGLSIRQAEIVRHVFLGSSSAHPAGWAYLN